MKYLLPILFVLALVSPGSRTWGSTVLPVFRPYILQGLPSHPALPAVGLETAPGGATAPRLSLPVKGLPDTTFEAASDPVLLPEPLVLSGLDVGINVLVDESTAGPSSNYGIGLLFTLENL
jgi:hypothetical protein